MLHALLLRLRCPRFALPLLLALTVAFAQPASAQDSTAAGQWVRSLTGKLNLAQAGFQNWQEGGVNTVAFTTGLNGKAQLQADRWEQKHEMRLAFGLVKQDTLDFRKAEDLIHFLSSLNYRGENFFEQFRPTIAASMRTQFAEGFNFDKDPIDGTRTPPVKVSDFFAPATLTQSLGLTYEPASWITQRLGVAAKETIVTIDRLRPLYGVEPDKTAHLELGIESYTEVDKDIAENINYKSKLGLFAAFNQTESPDVIWENLVTLKVNSWMNVNLEFVTLYDKDVSKDVQLKEVFSIGVAFDLL
jgi:hypothetical protein